LICATKSDTSLTTVKAMPTVIENATMKAVERREKEREREAPLREIVDSVHVYKRANKKRIQMSGRTLYLAPKCVRYRRQRMAAALMPR
jgi:hypothetical protein